VNIRRRNCDDPHLAKVRAAHAEFRATGVWWLEMILRNRRGQTPPTPGAAQKVLAMLRRTSATAKELSLEIYGDGRYAGRIYILVGALRKKGHAILIDGKSGQPGRRYLLQEPAPRDADAASPRSHPELHRGSR
jgi:hypothetical protein